MASTLAPDSSTQKAGYFTLEQKEAIKEHLFGKGYAIVKQVLDQDTVEQLKTATLRIANDSPFNETWGSRTCMNFVEEAPEALLLMENKPYMELIEHLHGTDELCFSRSACIARKPGNGVVRWHTDEAKQGPDAPPRNANEVLNQPVKGLNKFSNWFYLTGSRPSHGGIYVIENSHKPNWKPPKGFKATVCERSLNVEDGPDDEWYDKFDVPGMVQCLAEPGDLILFAANTYHAANMNQEDEIRLSCAVGFKPKWARINAPWDWPESAHAFKARLPQKFHRYLDGYTSIVHDWTNEES